ncbi:MAG: hypothetical protein Q8K45_09920 [Rubrivivax sp.]|jgi:hypothetical protein|nr:hypothetical protein [Rubrivivax sp.]
MEVMMTNGLRSLDAGSLFALAGAVMALAGCEAQGPTLRPSTEAAIESAINRVDHEAIAVRYEREAIQNADAAKRHLGYAAVYRRNISPRSGPEVHLALAKHCENLARTYQQAADESDAMAKLHRQLATKAD